MAKPNLKPRKQVAALAIRRDPLDGLQGHARHFARHQALVTPKGWRMKGREDHVAAQIEAQARSRRRRPHPQEADRLLRILEASERTTSSFAGLRCSCLRSSASSPTGRSATNDRSRGSILDEAADLVDEPGMSAIIRNLPTRLKVFAIERAAAPTPFPTLRRIAVDPARGLRRRYAALPHGGRGPASRPSADAARSRRVRRRSRSRRATSCVLDLVAAAAFLAQQQHALMGVAEMLARRIGVAALDLVQEAVLEEKLERAIDGRRRDRLAFLARQRVEDRVGAERGGGCRRGWPARCGAAAVSCRPLRRARALHFGHPGRPPARACLAIVSTRFLCRKA